MLVVAVQWDTLMIPEEQEVPAVVEQEAEHQPQDLQVIFQVKTELQI